ncbi:MAG: lytic transglycosylase domain-containing protein [Bacteroidaceae bacterium]|nr:lytic transglycosylase domain-containing protein [Bacteroidaceae bacterium]MBR5891097.1 lytic transglycosylase domain-containing protein [Bacteroidaceae bacterium]
MQNEPRSQVPYTVTSPEVPTSVEFAGEKIDLTRSDLRERMDREILTFTYSHINTQLMIKRANRLFPVIEPILKEQGMPDDIKYLMIIESNGDIYARSSVGASGLWQFMPATAKQYGLEVNNSVDERFNIEKATRAACRYLKNSYKHYGDWLTVAASYNTGENNVNKRIAAQKESKATDLALVSETSRYLFRLLTAKTVLSNPIRYGFLLKSSDLYPPVVMADTIETNAASIDFTQIAKSNGLNYMQLRDANPWIRSTSHNNANKKKYKILIPSKESLFYNPADTKPHNSAWVVK